MMTKCLLSCPACISCRRVDRGSPPDADKTLIVPIASPVLLFCFGGKHPEQEQGLFSLAVAVGTGDAESYAFQITGERADVLIF